MSCIVKFTRQSGRRPRTTGVGRARKPRSPKIPSTSLWHSLNVPLPRAPSKRGHQHGRRPVAFAALFTTKACDLRAVEALVEACFEEGRAADRAKFMLEAPARREPWGSETFKGCQRPFRRGYSAFENRPDETKQAPAEGDHERRQAPQGALSSRRVIQWPASAAAVAAAVADPAAFGGAEVGSKWRHSAHRQRTGSAPAAWLAAR